MADSDLLKDKVVGFLGGGNMAQAIGIGLMKKGVVSPSNIWVSSRTEKTLSIWKNYGVHTTLNNVDILTNCDIIFLAVKPQMFNEALKSWEQPKRNVGFKLFISVMLGITLDTLYNKLRYICTQPRIVRTMPNTPLMVSEGITVYCTSETTEEDEKIIPLLFGPLGLCEKIPESLINSVGALSGSGPAYLYLIIEALSDGAVRKGIPRDLATKFAAQVLVGAGKMVLETGTHPGQLKDGVTSPGGSTITGIHELERGGVRASLMNAIEAAVNRSEELSSLMGK